MKCHICEAEAVTRCYTCGELVCEKHGKNDTCSNCSTGIVAGDSRADRISTRPLPKTTQNPWWRPQQAEEYQPPACYECKGLSRAVCRNCQASYCQQHAGPNGLCSDCGRSARFGTYIFLGIVGMMALLFLYHWWLGL